MTKYFARIDRATCGPFTLAQLVDAGVRPSTYVWCKGMTEWQKAEEVADICRAMRCRLAGLPIPGEETAENGENRSSAASAPDGRLSVRGFYGFPEPDQAVDYDIKPQGISIFMAIMVSVLCFPFTGLVALWYAFRFRSLWKESESAEIDAGRRRQLRINAYEKARVYRMMIGITFFVGIMMAGLTLSSRFL